MKVSDETQTLFVFRGTEFFMFLRLIAKSQWHVISSEIYIVK
jgi:hypothetical protein